MVAMKVSSVRDDAMAARKAFSPMLHSSFSLWTRTTYGTVPRHMRIIGARQPRTVTTRITSAATGRGGGAAVPPSGAASVLGGRMALASVGACSVDVGSASMAAWPARHTGKVSEVSCHRRRCTANTPEHASDACDGVPTVCRPWAREEGGAPAVARVRARARAGLGRPCGTGSGRAA